MKVFYLFERQLLVMATTSWPRAWVLAFRLIHGVVYGSDATRFVGATRVESLLLVVAPQLSIWLGLWRLTWLEGSSLIDDEAAVIGDKFFEQVVMVLAFVKGLRNLQCMLWRVPVARRECKAVMTLEVLDLIRLMACCVVCAAMGRVPYCGQKASLLAYRVVMLCKLVHAVCIAIPLRAVSLWKPAAWRGLSPAASELLGAELVELERQVRQAFPVEQRKKAPTPPKWPPKLPTEGPPLQDSEIEKLSELAPQHLKCPIAMCLPLEPAVGVAGNLYDRLQIERAVALTGRDPLSSIPCQTADIRPNYAVRDVIDDFIDNHRHRILLVNDGDNLTSVAETHCCDVEELRISNPDLADPLVPGSALVLPTKRKRSDDDDDRVVKRPCK